MEVLLNLAIVSDHLGVEGVPDVQSLLDQKSCQVTFLE